MSTGNNPRKSQQKAMTARQIEQENEHRTAMNADAIPFNPKGVTQPQSYPPHLAANIVFRRISFAIHLGVARQMVARREHDVYF